MTLEIPMMIKLGQNLCANITSTLNREKKMSEIVGSIFQITDYFDYLMN